MKPLPALLVLILLAAFRAMPSARRRQSRGRSCAHCGRGRNARGAADHHRAPAPGAGGCGGGGPVRLILPGVVTGGFLASLSRAQLIFDAATMDAVRLWTTGSLTGQAMPAVAAVSPLIARARAATLIIRRQVGLIGLGDEIASGIGLNLTLWWGIAPAAALAGSAVALAGPLGFVGLIVPHAGRAVAGHRHARMLPRAALTGAGLLLAADTLGRSLITPAQIPPGSSPRFRARPSSAG